MKKLSIIIAFLCLTLVNRAKTFENIKEIQNLDFENIVKSAICRTENFL